MYEKFFNWKLKRLAKRGERYKRKKEIEDAYTEYMPPKRDRSVSNIMLVVIVTSIILYTIAAFVLQFRTSIEISPTLTTHWYIFWTSEIIMLAGIRVSKVFKNREQNQYYEE